MKQLKLFWVELCIVLIIQVFSLIYLALLNFSNISCTNL